MESVSAQHSTAAGLRDSFDVVGGTSGSMGAAAQTEALPRVRLRKMERLHPW